MLRVFFRIGLMGLILFFILGVVIWQYDRCSKENKTPVESSAPATFNDAANQTPVATEP